MSHYEIPIKKSNELWGVVLREGKEHPKGTRGPVGKGNERRNQRRQFRLHKKARPNTRLSFKGWLRAMPTFLGTAVLTTYGTLATAVI